MGEPTQTRSGATWQQVVIRAYLVSLGLAALITMLTTLLLVDATDCRSLERGLLVIAAAIVVVFLTSIIVVRVRLWKVMPGAAERWGIVIGYGAMLMATSVVIAFGLMVALNC